MRVRGLYNSCTNKFLCFNCQFLQDMSVQIKSKKDDIDRTKIRRNHLNNRLHNQYKYQPQIGDLVYFILPAYEELLAQHFQFLNFEKIKEFYKGKNFAAHFDVTYPQENFNNLNFPTLCQVVDIQYEFPIVNNKKNMEKNFEEKMVIYQLLTLQVMPNQDYSKYQVANLPADVYQKQ